MKQVDQTKVCSNCAADVSLEATYCPFCGTDLLSLSSEGVNPGHMDEKFSDQSLQESLASLYKPPYSVRNKQGLGVPDEREENSFAQAEPTMSEESLFGSYKNLEPSEPVTKMPKKEEIETVYRGSIWPLLVLSIGAHLFVLGLLILICSKDGVATLEWNAKFWFLYCLMSFPFLFFGTKLLKTSV